jgi:transposase
MSATSGERIVRRSQGPSRSPELNPVENVWQYLRQNWRSNRVFETHDDITDAAREAWNKLTAHPARITSIGMRD